MTKKRIKLASSVDMPDKIRFTQLDLIPLSAITHAQKIAFRSYFSGGEHLHMTGSAGTGKTLLALYFALSDVLDEKTPYNKVLIVRSIVPTRDIGFLKGTLEEKTVEYESPYAALCDHLFKYSNSYRNLKRIGKIEFISTSFVRGLTFDNTIIILDEAMSATLHELSSVVTRVGTDSKLIVCGDMSQNDLLKNKMDVSGYREFSRVLLKMPEVDVVTFKNVDIVRSAFVKSYLTTLDGLNL